MSNYIILNRKKHVSLLADHRIDPVTKELLKVGDEVSACAVCKTVYSRKVWDTIKKKTCCDQKNTLSEIPNTEYIDFEKKTDEQPAKNKKNNNYGCAFVFFLLTTIVLGIATAIWYNEYLQEKSIKESYFNQTFREKKQKQQLKSQVSEREKTIQKVADSYAPLLIKKIEFKADNRDYGNTMYTNTQYIRPRVSYTSISKTAKKIELYVKLYKPNGELYRAVGAPSGYTFSNSSSVEGDYKESAYIFLSGFGSEDRTTYTRSGKYIYEIWYKNRILYSTYFYIW